MSTTYNPNASNNPTSFTLPSDLDQATAESVNSPLRDLADKAAYALATRAALSLKNTFTRGQQFEPTDEGEPLIDTGRYPGSVTADNRWAQVMKLRVENDRNVRMYVGGLQGVGRLAFVLNCYWDVENQLWQIEDSDAEGSAVIWKDNSFSIYNVAAGTFPFLNWPNTGTQAEFRSMSEYKYLTPKSRVRTIPLASCSGPHSILSGNGAVWVGTGGVASHIRWPIRLPPGAAIQRIKIQHSIDESASETFRFTRRRPTWDTGSLAHPTESWLATIESSSDVGVHITTIEASGYVVDKYDDLSLVWVPSALSGNIVEGISIEWTDPGPLPI